MGHFVAACRRRVVDRFAQGAGKRFLRWTGPLGRRVLKFDGPLGRGLRIALSGNTYKVSVTGLAFYVIGMISITSISHLRLLSPLWCLTAPPSPRRAVGQ